MPRYLGIDYGDKRIGIAISDEDGYFAFPKVVLQNTLSVLDELKKIISLEHQSKIVEVIVGLPQNFSGEDTEQTTKVRIFAEKLKKELDIEVIFENEILTSQQIKKTNVSTKKMIDASSAALILQEYLNRKNKA